MKKFLNLIVQPLADPAKRIIDLQREQGSTEIRVLEWKEDNSEEVLHQVFDADAVCVWSQDPVK